MNKKDTRPVFLNLFQLKFAITAIISILHRISGFFLFLFIPLLLWMLGSSLRSEGSFVAIKGAIFGNLIGKTVIWIMLSTLIFHSMAGIRHLLMDYGWFESLAAARLSTFSVFILFGLAAISIGVWLW